MAEFDNLTRPWDSPEAADARIRMYGVALKHGTTAAEAEKLADQAADVTDIFTAAKAQRRRRDARQVARLDHALALLPLLVLGIIVLLLLAGCGGSTKGVAAYRAQQATSAPPVAASEPLPTGEPAQPTPAPVDALAVPWEAEQPVANTMAGDVGEFDQLITEALNYGGLGSLQFLVLALSFLPRHPAPRRAMLVMVLVGLVAAAYVSAMFHGFQPVDLIGFAMVLLMGGIAGFMLLGRTSAPAGSVNRG